MFTHVESAVLWWTRDNCMRFSPRNIHRWWLFWLKLDAAHHFGLEFSNADIYKRIDVTNPEFFQNTAYMRNLKQFCPAGIQYSRSHYVETYDLIQLGMVSLSDFLQGWFARSNHRLLRCPRQNFRHNFECLERRNFLNWQCPWKFGTFGGYVWSGESLVRANFPISLTRDFRFPFSRSTRTAFSLTASIPPNQTYTINFSETYAIEQSM